MARLLVLVATGCVIGLLVAGSASGASPVQGEFVSSKELTASGNLTGEGRGELQLFPGPGLGLEGQGQRIVVEEHRLQSHLVDSPLAPPVELVTSGGYEREEHVFEDATFSLRFAQSGFEALVMAFDEGDVLRFHSSGASDVSLVAYKDAGLILDDEGRPSERPDEWIFTYVAHGERFALPTSTATAEGDPSVYLWQAGFVVEQDGEEHLFESGAHQEETAPGAKEYEQTYFIVHVQQGHVKAEGDHLAWVESPSVALDGVLTAAQAHGDLNYRGDDHRLENVPVSAMGSLGLLLSAGGDVVPMDDGGTHIGTNPVAEGRYSKVQVALTGDESVLFMFAGVPVGPSSSVLVPVVGAAGVVGVLGAAWALSPHGKWALLSAVAPLYAKTQKNRLLESPHRERLLEAIRANPGVHISRLRELTEISWGTTVYHLRLMEKNGLVTSIPRAGQRHFFIKTPGVDAARLRTAVAAFVGQETAHRVAFAVLNLPGASQKELAEHLSVSSRVVTHHVGRLQKAGLLTKKRDGGFIRCYPDAALGDALALLDTGVVSARIGKRHSGTEVPMVQA